MNKLPKNLSFVLVVVVALVLLVGGTLYVTAGESPTGGTNSNLPSLENISNMLSAPSVDSIPMPGNVAQQDQGTMGQPQVQTEVERWDPDPGGTPSACNGSIKQTLSEPNTPDECIEGYFP